MGSQRLQQLQGAQKAVLQKRGYFLRITADGRVDGVRDKNDPRAPCTRTHIYSCEGSVGSRPTFYRRRSRLPPGVLHTTVNHVMPFSAAVDVNIPSPQKVKLQLQATSVGEVVIKGLSSNRYLAMNKDGRLFGVRRVTDECYFFERLESNNYNTYRSRNFPDWYVALKRNGQHKPGSKTSPGQKAILFLPMSTKS
ncbi:hypothetical protein AAFF_G00294700 [Aldrovandia affinis]|uniref:Fibroblast growth factor n=1 Tax=Aldrovandia affinis TaxID=143900 RepID=A0AAD7W0N3_9TELE|nr:hypothetical protein AAFF_G00294700 [Aldrovandia affinis]